MRTAEQYTAISWRDCETHTARLHRQKLWSRRSRAQGGQESPFLKGSQVMLTWGQGPSSEQHCVKSCSTGNRD